MTHWCFCPRLGGGENGASAAALFVEPGSGGESFHLGPWLSAYYEATAARLREPVMSEFALLQAKLNRS